MNRITSAACTILFAVTVPLTVWPQTVPAAISSDKAFADWLFVQGEYIRAAGEYYRCLFTAPEDEKEVLLHAIGACYAMAGEYRRALLAYEKLIDSFPSSPLFRDACFRAAYCSLKLDEYNAIPAQLGRAYSREEYSAADTSFLLLDAAGRLAAGDYLTGRLLLERYLAAPGAAALDEARGLISLLSEADHLEKKNALEAAALSVFVPGLGRAYAGRWEDGIVSFALCAGAGGLAVISFLREGTSSVSAWVYAVIGVVLYIGDIWGSADAARRFNEEKEDGFRRRVKERVDGLFP